MPNIKSSWAFGIDDFNVPAKSNSLEIKFNPNFWRMIADTVRNFRAGMAWKKTRGGNPYWIAPTKDVQVAQESIAWRAKEFIRKDITGPVELRIEAFGPQDIDNLVKVIMDGIQDSGRMKNDRQVVKLSVERTFSTKRRGFTVEVIEL